MQKKVDIVPETKYFCRQILKSTMKRLVIFDLDGTLLDTIADLGNAVNHTLGTHGLPCHTLPDYKMMVGRGMRNLCKAALPESLREDETFVDGFLKDFLDFYMTHIDCATLPYPGMQELVASLDAEGFALAVASNKLQSGTERLIRKFFPSIPFVAVCGNSPDFPLKPDAGLVKYIMDKAGVTADCTVMVGDSGIDIRTARNAGIPVIAVSWGFRPVSDLLDADLVVSTVPNLSSALFARERL